MTDTDESDYETGAQSEQELPIPRRTTRVSKIKHPSPAHQSTRDFTTLAQILVTIGRLETRMNAMAEQLRTQKGPIGRGPMTSSWTYQRGEGHCLVIGSIRLSATVPELSSDLRLDLSVGVTTNRRALTVRRHMPQQLDLAM